MTDRSEQGKVLAPFTVLFDRFTQYGPAVAEELISAANDLGGYPRGGLSHADARLTARLVNNAMPCHSLTGPRPTPISDVDRSLFRQGTGVGWALVYDGVKYLQDLHVVGAGSEILWTLLRFARVNPKEGELRQEVAGYFGGAIKEAQAAGFGDAIRWLQFSRDDALAADGDPLPDMPRDIERKLHSGADS